MRTRWDKIIATKALSILVMPMRITFVSSGGMEETLAFLLVRFTPAL
jgi:hypothetical protein